MLLSYNRRLLPFVRAWYGMGKGQDWRLARVAENRQDKGLIHTEQLCSYYQYHKHAEKMVLQKQAAMTMLLPYNRRLLPLVGA